MRYLGQEPTQACLLPQIEQVAIRARELAGELTQDALLWRPPGGGWSVGQVLEHLLVSGRIYFPVIERVIAKAVKPASPAPWKPSLWGRMLISTLSPANERTVRTFSRLRPGPEARVDVLDAFLGSMLETAALLRRADGLDMRRLRLNSPVVFFVRGLNLGDAFIIIVVHAQRHLRQIERVMGEPGFPQPSAIRTAPG